MTKNRIVKTFSSVLGASLEANSVECKSLRVLQECVEFVVCENAIKIRQVIQQGKLNHLYAFSNYIPGDSKIEITFLKIKDSNISYRVPFTNTH